jgi:hypothetical protein
MPSHAYSKPEDSANPTSLSPRALAEDLRDLIAQAERQLQPVTEAQAALRPGPGKWSLQQTVGHLIDSAANNLQRLVRLQIESPLIFPGYRQEEWVRIQCYDRMPWAEVRSLFFVLNRHFAHVIEQADRAAFANIWLHEGEPHTLGFVLVDYMGHLRHHLRQMPNI